MSKITQGTEAWLAAKQSKISASEVFSLVNYYCRPELEILGFNLKEEKSFRTVQELFLKVKFGAKLSAIDPIHSEFGNGLEPYVAYRLGEEVSQFKVERSKDFIVNEVLHPLAACSPDGFIEIMNDSIVDFDKTCKIDSSWGIGALELKTANYFANFGSDKGSRLNYIFQLQFQLMVMELKWGCLAVLMPKEKEFDEPFFKGRILERIKIFDEIGSILDKESWQHVNQCYDLKYYIYPQLPAFQAMIMKSLHAFQADLDAYDSGDQSAFPRNSEDLAGLEREKSLWAQLWPEKFGTLELDPKSKLNQLLIEQNQAREEVLFADQNKLKIECEINQLIMQNGLGKYKELKGSDNRLMWDKRGSLRFYKNKEK